MGAVAPFRDLAQHEAAAIAWCLSLLTREVVQAGTHEDACARAMEMLPSDHGHPWADRLVQLPPPLFPAIRATPDGPYKVVTLVYDYRIEYRGVMKDILTAEVDRYRERHGEVGMTREDVIMLEILEATLAREGREQGLTEGLEAGREQGIEQGREVGLEIGRLQERIANLEGMRERGNSWETIETLTRIDEAGLHQLRAELACRETTARTIPNHPQEAKRQPGQVVEVPMDNGCRADSPVVRARHCLEQPHHR